MEVLTNYLENDYVQKNCAIKAADWILTPYRNLFNGKDIELIITRNEAQQQWNFGIKETPYRTSPLKKTLFAIAAILISPLALIAALFKRCGSPSVEISGEIGSKEIPFTKQEDIAQMKQVFNSSKLPGNVTYWETIYPNMAVNKKTLSGSDGWRNSRYA